MRLDLIVIAFEPGLMTTSSSPNPPPESWPPLVILKRAREMWLPESVAPVIVARPGCRARSVTVARFRARRVTLP